MFQFRRVSEFATDRKGAGTLEFVLTLPLYLLALGFAFEFGRFLLAHQSVVNNVRSAARYLARSDMSGASQTNAVRIVRTGRMTTPGVTPDYLEPANAVVTVTPTYSTFSAPTFREAGRTMRIRVDVSYRLSSLGMLSFGQEAGVLSIPFTVIEDLRYTGS
jgi:Flp pilus assembly protein TadG